MAKQQFQNEADTGRDELLQQLLERMFSLMRHVQRDVSVIKPSLSHPQARLVFIINKYDDSGISVKELARLTSVTPGAITQLIDALIDKKLITRETDTADRRSIKLKLTSAARKEIHQFRKDFFSSIAEKFNVLSTDELKELVSLITKVSPEPITKEDMP
ncbi:MarR family winged helix-turn-helix transcriptional regulator [Dehalococcoides mccartyi]|jgi:DNA-binding MarR family transcriptional regulator|uniref:MarR family transcriptional regulator n=1 Tax=Dehalococcoides mccartyi TaxID=61435 RepID=A0A142VBW0_9CHLR|nr:MarR family transcriptional regulator [Dehalococcoides mccartyi]AII61140.1 MarR family transcriptional regulator [Dehalococcoides mccartyi CG5]AMU86827.1 MarR family transcriptional regulator [Dehalococcoides mccartyi]MBA2085395.1 Transcriptional regulator, MarR family [Dehalococcoides mccartyi]QBX64155.1 MarR family transcriptional regulator [Dehalococcoides mccartyi]BCT56154.1 transcriptional regulator, MarR family NIT01rdhR [Dehalococcoides mccartyi]